MDWEFILQQNQTQSNKDNINKNINRVDHDYQVEDMFMLNNHACWKVYL